MCLILTATLGGEYYLYANITDEETEAHRDEATCQKLHGYVTEPGFELSLVPEHPLLKKI